MNNASRQPGFPLLSAAAALTAICVVVLVVAAWAVPALFTEEPGALRAAMVAGGLSWAAAIFSLLPVHMLGPLGVMPAVWGYFMGATGRIVMCLVGLALAVKVGHLPAFPFAVTLVAMYLPMLFVEAGCVGRYVWNKDSLPRSDAPAGQAAEVLA